MLSHDRNERLTRVGPGTPAGNLLRRYWQPLCPVADLTPEKPKKRPYRRSKSASDTSTKSKRSTRSGGTSEMGDVDARKQSRQRAAKSAPRGTR